MRIVNRDCRAVDRLLRVAAKVRRGEIHREPGAAPCGEIKPFTASANIRFRCVNAGYIDAPALPGLKLAHCRLAD
ncbi:hypothetical protein [Burkholderia sp. Bp8998]|uniref:hypothetical protein n=1 Tax=Burkholderia sp. Bp8998 TaxID=2184557 RepID=UPI000F5B8179|nr:hypothetical protein [Burkholderia sp. Bp8998]RQS10893.1 hypothetical protein DIE06_29250 [Burkholderia sp. Bp8998]